MNKFSIALIAVGSALFGCSEEALLPWPPVPLQLTPITSDGERIARYGCRTCSILSSHELDFGYEADAPDRMSARVAIDSIGQLWLAGTYREGTVAVYNSSGELLRSVGRSGEGPGEFKFVQDIVRAPTGELYISDPRNSRISVFNSAFELIRVIRTPVPPRRVSVVGDGKVVVHGGNTLGVRVLSPEGRELRTLGVHRGKSEHEQMLLGDYVFASDPKNDRIFILNAAAYEILVFSADSLIGPVQGGVDWFDSYSNPEPAKLPRQIDAIVDDGGRLWTMTLVPDPEWDPERTKRHLPPPDRYPGDIPPSTTEQLGEIYDTVLEVWDMRAGKLVTGIRVDEYLKGYAGSEHVFTVIEEPGGDAKVRLWRLGLDPYQ